MGLQSNLAKRRDVRSSDDSNIPSIATGVSCAVVAMAIIVFVILLKYKKKGRLVALYYFNLVFCIQSSVLKA